MANISVNDLFFIIGQKEVDITSLRSDNNALQNRIKELEDKYEKKEEVKTNLVEQLNKNLEEK